MRLVVAAIAVFAACGSGGHGGSASGGSGGGGRDGAAGGPHPFGDAKKDAQSDGPSGAGDAADAAPTFSCFVADEAGPPACIQLDPGDVDASPVCGAADAGPVITGACPRDMSAGGCHVAITSATGYTIWWYAPTGAGAVLARCEEMDASYVSP